MDTALTLAAGVALAAARDNPSRDGGRCVGTAGDDTLLGRAIADDMAGRTSRRSRTTRVSIDRGGSSGCWV